MHTATLDLARDRLRTSDYTGRTSTAVPLLVGRSQTNLPTSEKPRPRRSWRPFAAGLVLVAAAAATAANRPWKLLSAAPVSAESDGLVVPRKVDIARPAADATANVVLPATFRPWQTATLYARVNGYLKTWRPDLGATVKEGELLAEIETPELDRELAQGEALVKEANAAVVQAQAEREEAQADLKVAEAQLGRVQAEADLAKSQLSRREKLLASRSVSQEEYETAQRQVEARVADVAAAESDIVRRRTNLATRAAIIDSREATAKSRQSNVDRLNELQRFKRIVAPFDGVVTRRAAEVGMLVTAGTDSLYVVEDMSRVRVQMHVPQAYAAQTGIGVVASISLPESTRQAVEATITRVSDSVDATSRTMLAEIELDNSRHHFQPGSYAQVKLITRQAGTSWTIPTNTLSMWVSGPHVAVVDDRDQIVIKRVTLGRDLGRRVVVAEGIRGDERLVVNPGDDLVDGVVVQATSRESDQRVVQR